MLMQELHSKDFKNRLKSAFLLPRSGEEKVENYIDNSDRILFN